MAAGYSRVRIFSPNGIALTEIDVTTKRSWVLNDVGRCQFVIPVYDPFTGAIHGDCSPINFAYGNLVLIEHMPSKNDDGTTNGLLPSWVGVIQPPQAWEYGQLTVTAMSAEQLLAYRPMPLAQLTGTPGGIFQQILSNANAVAAAFGGIQIQPGQIDMGGTTQVANLKTSGLDEIRNIVKRGLGDWDITPAVDSNGVLHLIGNWYQEKGIDSGQVLSNLDIQNSRPLYTEQGTFYNVVYAYTDANTPGSRAAAISSDPASIAANGVLATSVVFPGTAGAAQSVIQAMSDAWLANSKNPTRTFAPTVLDVGNAFSYCVTGNTWLIQVDTVGFSGGGIGLTGAIRVTAAEYDELSNSVRFAGVMQ